MEYYTRRPNANSLSITSSSSRSAFEEASVEDDALAAAFEQSMYLFPNPPSAPPSPAPSSSRTSASAAIYSPSLSVSVSRERSLTESSGATGTASAGEWEDVGTPLSLRPSDGGSPVPDSHGQGLLDRSDWDWSPMDEAEASMLEEQIARASRWDMAAALRRRVDSLADAEARRRAQQQLQESSQSQQTAEGRLGSRRISYIRSRTTSTATTHSPTPLGPTPLGPTPHPRIYIPLLSFFASLLSLDSSTLHLLSHTPAHSILFPGSSIVGDSSPALEDPGRSHGLEGLFTPASERTSVKEGLNVACDQDIVPSSPFFISPFNLNSIFGMGKVIWPGERWRTVMWGSSDNH